MQHSAVSMSRLRNRRVNRSGRSPGPRADRSSSAGPPSQRGRPLLLAKVEDEVVEVQVVLDDGAVAELGQPGGEQLDSPDLARPGVVGEHIEQFGLTMNRRTSSSTASG